MRWQDFKHPTAAALHQNSIARFGTVSGNGRYELLESGGQRDQRATCSAARGRGRSSSCGSREPRLSYVQNAHSLYLETLSDVGVVGSARSSGSSCS